MMPNQDEENTNNGDELGSALYQRTEELYQIPEQEVGSDGFIECPAIVLKEIVVFPHMISPIFVTPGKNLLAIQNVQSKNKTLIALIQKKQTKSKGTIEDFYNIGIEMAVGRLLTMPDGNCSALVQGRRRVEIAEIITKDPFPIVKARVIEVKGEEDRQINALMRTTRDLFDRCVQLDRTLPDEAHLFSLNITEPGWLADMVATALSLPLDQKIELLLMTHSKQRLMKINKQLAQELDVLQLEDEIQIQVQKEVDRSQREYYLREQIKAIQTELGEGDFWQQEISLLKQRIIEADLPEEPNNQVMKDIERLSQMQSMAPEVAIIKNYIDWVIELPWKRTTEDNLDVKNASAILNNFHYGLQKPKDRIIEYIAVKSLKPKREKQPVLCFVGPPGTGKTSLGRSFAKALGREFVRISLGGVKDEAEIRGHRRTYIGALPGRIIQTIKRAGSSNPLFMLDEIDKLGTDFRGDPSSALLEVLDPEQNFSFSDHYLEIPFDLSKVMFITTANQIGTIPPALLDRMEVIEFSGYIEEEKIEIANRFLIPKQIEENGIEKDEISFNKKSISKIIREYTYEAGVRNLEREIGRICRKTARLKSEGNPTPARLTINTVERLLGPPQFFNTEAEKEDEVGVATAVAWTENGGEIMPVEVVVMEGKGNLQVTGQIGDIMQESAQAAYSYIKSRANIFDIDPDRFENIDIHVHIPEGSIPKDGPSAGITICSAIISALCNRKVNKEIGMTGEITLRGSILPVGGIKDKILAAHRAGLKKLIIPDKNIKDLIDVPKKVLDDIQIVKVIKIDQVIKEALYESEK